VAGWSKIMFVRDTWKGVAMPLYVYEEILPDGSAGATFELIQSIHEAALTQHPQTGVPVRRKVTAPGWSPTPFGKHDKKEQLSDKNLEKLGFTKYVKGKAGYDKVTGDGPDRLNR
jgi:predicted nucleic acid-binding Zn ribbon protein